ncbi:hypothetical protein AMTRI_Chr03g143630 [Amborella trichopoda]
MLLIVVAVSTLIFLLLTFLISNYTSAKAQAPSPPKWPIIGHLHLLGKLPHQSLAALSLTYGPIMPFKLGMRKAVVISSPHPAKQIFKTHDRKFSSRPVPLAAKTLSYGGNSLVWAAYGHHWRLLRRLSLTELFSTKRLNSMEKLRRAEVSNTMASIYEESIKGNSINIGSTVFSTMLGIVENMVCGNYVFKKGDELATELKGMVRDVLKLSGEPNASDFFPFLRGLDLQGVERRAQKLRERFDGIFSEMIERRLKDMREKGMVNERDEESGRGIKESDFLGVLLELMDHNEGLQMEHVKGMLMDMFIAGTDTTSATVEWAMAELLNHPYVMEEARDELRRVIGKDKMMEESHIPDVPFLQAIVKEVLRLHPAAPLLIPRLCDSDCQIDGHIIEKNTEVLVNVWAIGRDPKVWSDPLKFDPSRFVGTNLEFKGNDYELLPFGAGRRICIGMPLASSMVHLVLGSLLHYFNWKVEGEVDMTEEFGITLQKALPLVVVATPSLPLNPYL